MSHNYKEHLLKVLTVLLDMKVHVGTQNLGDKILTTL